MVGFKSILVATDFGAVSEQAVEYATAIASRFGAALHFVHVLDDTFPVGAEIYVDEIPHVRNRMKENAQRLLDHLILEVPGLVATSAVLIGKPARRIVEEAASRSVDLIVMGTHGSGPVVHWLMGNVAERVVRTAPCPVLTVRATDRPNDDEPTVQPQAPGR